MMRCRGLLRPFSTTPCPKNSLSHRIRLLEEKVAEQEYHLNMLCVVSSSVVFVGSLLLVLRRDPKHKYG